MKMSNYKKVFIFLVVIALISSIFPKKNHKKKTNKRTHKRSSSKLTLSMIAKMISPDILNDKFSKNLYSKNLQPDSKEEDKLLLTKSLIAGVLKILNVSDDKIEAKMNTISKDELLKIMKILIKFNKTTSHVDVLQKLGDYKIDGLDVQQISPGLAMNVTQYLQKHIILHGR